MKVRYCIGGFVAGCAVTIAGAAALTAQDPAEMEQAMAEAMAKYGVPGEEHAELAKRVGAWNVDLKYWWAPGAEAQVMTGQSHFQMIMDGRYLFQEFVSEYQGETFEGGGLVGYDRLQEKYQGIWIDNMSTGIAISEGQMKDGVLVTEGDMPDPMIGATIHVRNVEKWVDENTWVMEMYRPGPDGKEFRSMQITYTRAE